MALITHDAKLNELLVDLGRSLLQYVSESSPWTVDAARASIVQELAAQQRQHVARIVELLNERRWPVDLGTYPTEYTDYHFLSLEYFLPRLVVSQEALVAELDEAAHTCVDDTIAVQLLTEILHSEQQILQALRSLVASNIAA